MSTKKERTAMELFQYGYEDSVIAARSELAMSYVTDLRVIYNTYKTQEVLKKNGK